MSAQRYDVKTVKQRRYNVLPVGKITEKAVCRSVLLTTWHCMCTFDNMALYLKCWINKNALLQTVFLVILPCFVGCIGWWWTHI